MEHGFSELEWLAYFEGRLPAEKLARLDAHVAECPECAEFVRRSRKWEQELAAVISQAGVERFTGPGRVEELLVAALEKVDFTAPSRMRPSGAVLLLRRLLEPLLGRRAADRFIELAIRRSSLAATEDLELQIWPQFIEHLGLAAGSVAGANTERMIARAGAQLAAEMM